MQITINILSSFSIFLLVAFSFSILYTTNKFFDMFLAVIISISPYLTFLLTTFGFNFLTSSIISIILSIIFYLFVHILAYNKLLHLKVPNLILLIVSLGFYIICQNLIALIWGYDNKAFHLEISKNTFSFFNSVITYSQLITFSISISIFFAITFLIRWSNIGMKIRALSDSHELFSIFGLSSFKIRLFSITIASFLASIAGILYSIEYSYNPTFGFNLLLYGIVAMIIGGVGSSWGLVGGSLLLATAQHLGAYYIDSKWMDAIAYIILILFLIWKPLGFSGNRLKKVEI